MDPERLPFADFLRDVLYESATESHKANQVQGLIALDFCDSESLDLVDGDFGLLDKWNAEGTTQNAWPAQEMMHGRADRITDITQTRRDLVKIWTNFPSSRNFDSQEGDFHEQRNSSLSPGELDKWRSRRDQLALVTRDRLEQSNRDRALAMVLSASRQHATSIRIASSFPSLDLMEVLVTSFLSNWAYQASDWIHLPTFRLNSQAPEWIAMAAASGAVSSPIPALRRFGFTLQEAVREFHTVSSINTSMSNWLTSLLGTTISQRVRIMKNSRRKFY